MKSTDNTPVDLLNYNRLIDNRNCNQHQSVQDHRKFKKRKRNGDTYEISVSLTKKASNELVESLTILTNKCFPEETFSDGLKLSRIILAIPKKKVMVNDYYNYRPIASFPALLRIWKAAIKTTLTKYTGIKNKMSIKEIMNYNSAD